VDRPVSVIQVNGDTRNDDSANGAEPGAAVPSPGEQDPGPAAGLLAVLSPAMLGFAREVVAAAPPVPDELIAGLRQLAWDWLGSPPPSPGREAPARRTGTPAASRAAGLADPRRPGVHTADEAALLLKCTPNWLKEHARLRRIPFTMVGGSYRWTDAHLQEIIRIGEHQPEPPFPPRPYVRRPPEMPAADDVPLLQARTPRGPRKKPSG
jgi:hypothetical protein